jgi:predicted membrane protein
MSIYSGIGSQSGRFISGVGKTIIRGVENVVIIRRRISQIRALCPLFDDSPPVDVAQIYGDLLEFVRYVLGRNNNVMPDSDCFGTDLTSILKAFKLKRYASSAIS